LTGNRAVEEVTDVVAPVRDDGSDFVPLVLVEAFPVLSFPEPTSPEHATAVIATLNNRKIATVAGKARTAGRPSWRWGRLWWAQLTGEDTCSFSADPFCPGSGRPFGSGAARVVRLLMKWRGRKDCGSGST